MTAQHFDPYGLEYGDWEDPDQHHIGCIGCVVCLPWEGRPAAVVRRQRMVLVQRWRLADGTDLTPQEAARQDDDYWNNRD